MKLKETSDKLISGIIDEAISDCAIDTVTESSNFNSDGKRFTENMITYGHAGMTIKDVCDGFGIDDIGDFSDGYHTFNQLYHQRAVLFAAIVNSHPEISWKSKKHEDGKYCFESDGKWFVVGIDTPEGQYSYHYETEPYWDMFKCEELPVGKHWDGHTELDVTRLLSLR